MVCAIRIPAAGFPATEKTDRVIFVPAPCYYHRAISRQGNKRLRGGIKGA
jgi:hypothetical protein